MMAQHEEFIQAIHAKKRVKINFRSKEDRGSVLTRICAPMDYGPGKKQKDGGSRYWFWDYTSDTKAHTLGLSDGQIMSMTVTDDEFDPTEFVDWATDWIIPRDWGSCS
jgi:hypothetical protein